jgi:hypothetical protein
MEEMIQVELESPVRGSSVDHDIFKRSVGLGKDAFDAIGDLSLAIPDNCEDGDF